MSADDTLLTVLALFLERRFNAGVRLLLSWIMVIFSILTKIAISLWASALVFKTLFGWNPTLVIWIVAVITALYTMKGGLATVRSPRGGPAGDGEPVSKTKVTKSVVALVETLTETTRSEDSSPVWGLTAHATGDPDGEADALASDEALADGLAEADDDGHARLADPHAPRAGAGRGDS